MYHPLRIRHHCATFHTTLYISRLYIHIYTYYPYIEADIFSIFFWKVFWQKMMRRQVQDQQSRVFYELSSMVLNILRSPPTPIDFSDEPPASEVVVRRRRVAAPPQQITPAGFASLLLGISLALMLCGSVTFFIGFMLMPWVLGLVMIFYVVGIVSSLSMLGRTLLCCSSSSPATPRKDPSSWKLL